MGLWSEEAYLFSTSHALSRRLSFDVPLPVKVVDRRVVQRLEPGKPGVCVTEPLTMLAGRAVVITWYSAMSEALQQSDEHRVWYLFNAALSVPIRMRVLPDGDAIHLTALSFSETMFASCAASGADSFWRFAEKNVPRDQRGEFVRQTGTAGGAGGSDQDLRRSPLQPSWR